MRVSVEIPRVPDKRETGRGAARVVLALALAASLLLPALRMFGSDIEATLGAPDAALSESTRF